jgi:hypothetical protein
MGTIEPAQLQRLVDEARASHFADDTDAYGLASEAALMAMATYDHCILKYAYASEGVLEAERLFRLANLIDRVVGTRDRIP